MLNTYRERYERKRSDWSRRRKEQSDASLGTERKHGETKWSRVVATFNL